MASLGSSTAIWKISLRFFSPPEKPSLTERLSSVCSISSSFILSFTNVQKLHGVEFRAALLADFVERGLEKIGAVHAGNLDRVLEGEEQSFARAFLRVEVEQVLAVVNHLAAGHVVTVAPGQHGGQRAFAAAVRAHDGVDFAGGNREVDAFQDFPSPTAGVQIFDFENAMQLSFI